MGAEASTVPPAPHREAPDQPAPLYAIGVKGVVGLMMITSWSVATVRCVTGAMPAAT